MMENKQDDAQRVWDERYSAPEYIFGTDANAYLSAQRYLFKRGQRALAVADGEGRNSVWLAGQGLQVDAFDISSVALAKAAKLAREACVEVNYRLSDCDAWEWADGGYDVVVGIFIQFAAPEMRRRLFANMVRSLKPGGVLILQGYTPRQLEFKTGGPGVLENLYTEELLRTEFDAMRIVELDVYDAVLREGDRHAGLSALIGMVARKR